MKTSMNYIKNFVLVLLLAAGSNSFAQPGNPSNLQLQTTAATGKEFQEIKAGMINAEIEEALLTATQKEADTKNWKQKYIAAKIISGNWTEIKDASGKVTGRSIEGMVYGIGVAGNCNYQQFTFHQNYNGKTFDATSTNIAKIGQQHRCSCAQ